MKMKYSKPSADVKVEAGVVLENERSLYIQKKKILGYLKASEPRAVCLLCGAKAGSDKFLHRGIRFFTCSQCGHLQSCRKPPVGYPQRVRGGYSFEQVYPKLTPTDYQSRKARIYAPKADWIFDVLRKSKTDCSDYREWRWIDIGSGMGYFVAELEERGVDKVRGFDRDLKLVRAGNSFLKRKRLFPMPRDEENVFQKYPADIFTAFFVLEHIEDLVSMTRKISKIPVGCYFCFSVPVFGFSSILDTVFSSAYARNFDGVIHTQLFTDTSIQFFLKQCGLEVLGEWRFGQDAMDMDRYLKVSVGRTKGNHPLFRAMYARMARAMDQFQRVLDKNGLCDQRHIMARKV